MSTVARTGRFINVSAFSADFDFGASFPNENVHGSGEVRVKRITYEGNDADKLWVRNGAAGAVVVCILEITAEVPCPTVYFGEEGSLMKPYIDISECTKAGTELVIIELA